MKNQTAFSELYLDDAMKNMGEMIEYGEEACRIEQDLLLQMFIVSGYAYKWEHGDPHVLSGLSGTELCCRVLEKCRDIQSPDDRNPGALIRYDTGDAYWRGYILALFQWKTNCSFTEISAILQQDQLQRMYPAYHTASEEKAIEELERLLAARRAVTRLQMYRKRLGLSQQELAERAVLNLRTLQEYEVGRKDLRKAGSERVLALSRALWCDPSDLLA